MVASLVAAGMAEVEDSYGVVLARDVEVVLEVAVVDSLEVLEVLEVLAVLDLLDVLDEVEVLDVLEEVEEVVELGNDSVVDDSLHVEESLGVAAAV